MSIYIKVNNLITVQRTVILSVETLSNDILMEQTIDYQNLKKLTTAFVKVDIWQLVGSSGSVAARQGEEWQWQYHCQCGDWSQLHHTSQHIATNTITERLNFSNDN